MLNIFKKDAVSQPLDVKGFRDAFLRFIKEELQKVEGGEGRHIKGLHLFIACCDEEKHLYESAVYLEDKDLFRNEIQKIADDFAIDVPDLWTLDITFEDSLPAQAIKIPDLDAALFIKTHQHTIQKSSTAYIRVLSGEAEKEEYTLSSGNDKITIGREKKVQIDGFFRLNTIAFPTDSINEYNKYISRQHAHIEWNNDSNCFMLFADDGGVPPVNKIKVKSARDENPIKLNSTLIGHPLQEKDQVILGESAVLEFSYLSKQG